MQTARYKVWSPEDLKCQRMQERFKRKTMFSNIFTICIIYIYIRNFIFFSAIMFMLMQFPYK